MKARRIYYPAICCNYSVEPAGGAAERHEGRCDAATGYAIQSPANRRPPANVGEEHPQPTGQQGHRDAHAPGQQPVSNPRTFIRTHANAERAALTFNLGKEKELIFSTIFVHFLPYTICSFSFLIFLSPGSDIIASFLLCSPYLQDLTQPIRTTVPPSPLPHPVPSTWEGPTTVRCLLDPSYQVSFRSLVII